MHIREIYKLDELIGVKKYHNYTADEVLKILANDDIFYKIGSGLFGTVLEVPGKNYVYKVFDNDDPYLSFVNYAIQHPNQHFPKFIKKPKTLHSFYRRAPHEPHRFTVVAIEKLEKLNGTTDADFIFWLLTTLRRIHRHKFDIKTSPTYLPTGHGNYNNLTYEEIMQAYPQVSSIIQAFSDMHHSGLLKGQYDLHGGNIMKRNDGTFVIIDPVAGSDSKISAQSKRDYIADIEKTTIGPSYTKPKKVVEMIGVKKYSNLTVDKLLTHLSDTHGLGVLGAGAFGKVLEVPNKNYVYKIFDNDNAYLSFVNYVIKNPNKHFPKFLKSPKLLHSFYRRSPIEPNMFTAVAIEKLQPLSQPNYIYAYWIITLLEDIIHNTFIVTEWPAELPNGNYNHKKISYEDIMVADPNIASIINAFLKMYRSGDVIGDLDLHLSNIMQRTDGTLVITDPVKAFRRDLINQKKRNEIPDTHKTVTGPKYKENK